MSIMRADIKRDILETMPGVPPIVPLKNSVISGRIFDGKPSVTLKDGRPARLAVVDEDGCIVEAGNDVAQTVWAIAITTYCTALLHGGHMKVTTEKPC